MLPRISPPSSPTSLLVLPVIDLMRGLVVRGVGGRRESYEPIRSLLCDDARPASVARALAEAGFRQTYVADLDAIAGAPPAWSTYAELIRAGLDLWVDAGISSAARAQDLADFETDARRLLAIV